MIVFLPLLLAGCGGRRESDPPTTSSAHAPEPVRVPAETVAPVPEPTDGKLDRDKEMARARELINAGNLDGAATTFRQLLLVNPDDFEIVFRLATIEASRGNVADAIGLLNEIPEDHPEAGIPALGQSADWCMQLGRYGDAEQRYRRVIERIPTSGPARRQLAYLFNRQGRRQDAAAQVRELCKLGNVRQDELQSLINLSDAIYDDPEDPDSVAPGDRPYWPIGPEGEARYLFGQTKFDAVIETLQPVIERGDASPSALALYGRAAAESQDDERLAWWLAKSDERTKEYSDYWAAIGLHEVGRREYRAAARALAEAIDRDPTDYLSIGRLRQCLSTLGEEELSKRWYDRWLAIRETAKVNGRVSESGEPNPDAIAELASLLFHLNRKLEATMWKSMEGFHRKLPKSDLVQWNAQRQQLVADGSGFPKQADRLCGMDLSGYPLPKLDIASAATTPKMVDSSAGDDAIPVKFQNVADSIGLNHTYSVSSEPQQYQHAIYQQIGGAVAALDYDLDGNVDLYLAQGAADPPGFQSDRANQLFRGTGAAVIDVTDSSSAAVHHYTIGLTAGDWNQDGFPDLVVASIGRYDLLINCGDGTFARHKLPSDAAVTRLPSSSAMADVTGDGLPDIVQTIYVDDANMIDRPDMHASGRVASPMSPGDFELAQDELIVSDGVGGFKPGQLGGANRYAGLGIVITDFDQRPGNEIFVGNDLYPNQLWVRADDGNWSDAAPILGCAYGFSGLATGSMGIATGDFNGNGMIDLHITNFEEENASLFLGEAGAFRDRNVQFQLGKPSYMPVGFGTQTIDYDNDGELDLVVTNGHLDDSIENDFSYKQPAQFFRHRGSRFELAEVDDPSGYWDNDHLGRGLARVDFNRDGKSDVVITHIGEEPTALLLNQTETDHHWVQIQLIGTSSERDAIGAMIQIRIGGQTRHEWVTAGDGYLSHNEDVITFGLGDAKMIDEIVIQWPGGHTQRHGDLAADQRLLVVEQQDEPFVLAAPRIGK